MGHRVCGFESDSFGYRPEMSEAMRRRRDRTRATGGSRSVSIAGAVLALALASLALPPAAQASHDNGTSLCSNKFDGTFAHLNDFPLYRNGPGTTQVGSVSVNYQWQNQRRQYRVCVATVRRWHSVPKDTWAWVQRNGAFYRVDRGPFYRYAGPVVGAMSEGQQINGGGRLLGACASFGVSWPVGGHPQINGGGCS